MQKISPEISVEAILRILLVEDSPTDAELIVRRLHHDGLAFTYRRVETADCLVRELVEFDPDILLSDNRLPHIDAASAIKIVAGMRPNLPIVIVTGTLEDEAAVGLIKAGARDFIRKDRLDRLPVAVTAALKRAHVQRIRREQEAKLRESEERSLILLHSHVTEALYLLDPEGNIESWNASAERVKGYTSAEVIGRNFSMFYTPEDVARGEPARFLSDARVNGLNITEGWRVRKDGTRFLARVALDPIRLDNGTLRGFVKATLDITDQRAGEEQRARLSRELALSRDEAERANNAKSRFLATVTHELRTPLHGILGYAELLGLEGGLNPKQSALVATMITAGEHLLGMINSVLDMSQIEADRLELAPVEFDLPDLANACLNVVRQSAEVKGLALVLTAPTPIRVVTDVTRLRQVLINLLGNAIKFTPSGRVELRVTRTEAGDFVRLEIADTGPGIWAKHRDKLFQTFERLNANAVAGIEGAGLGLALSAQLVRAMNGRIGYEDNPGGGSIFWVELPANGANPATAEVALTTDQAAWAHLRVLVVDDDALNRDIADRFLTLGGHQVVCLDNGAAAVDAAGTEDFDVILMDVRMPGMNGLEATRLIRLLPFPRGMVPVIALTAQAFAEQIEICRQAGMNTHVSKPFGQAVLLAAVEHVTRSRRTGAPKASATSAVPLAAKPKLTIFDRAAFEDTTSCLSPEELGEHLRTLLARAQTLLSALRAPDILARASELSAPAHKLAGGAAMLGFRELAQAGREFEICADAGGPDAVPLADQLTSAIDAAVTVMRQELTGVASPTG